MSGPDAVPSARHDGPAPPAVGAPFRVIFVCLGNICRSPMAEAVFRRLVEEAGLGSRVVVESAGTGDYHVGEGVDPRALAALRRGGYDAVAHRARQFARDWFDRADLVVAMDAANFAALVRLAPNERARAKVRLLRSYDDGVQGEERDVPDPYYGGPNGFGGVLALVESACRGLLEEVRRRSTP